MKKERTLEFRRSVVRQLADSKMTRLVPYEISRKERGIPASEIKIFREGKEKELLSVIKEMAENHENYFSARTTERALERKKKKPAMSVSSTSFLVRRQDLLQKAKTLFSSFSENEKYVVIYDLFLGKIKE